MLQMQQQYHSNIQDQVCVYRMVLNNHSILSSIYSKTMMTCVDITSLLLQMQYHSNIPDQVCVYRMVLAMLWLLLRFTTPSMGYRLPTVGVYYARGVSTSSWNHSEVKEPETSFWYVVHKTSLHHCVKLHILSHYLLTVHIPKLYNMS